jgi:N-acetylmuramoyl-L-alanine amidase
MIRQIILDNGHGCNTPGKQSPIWSDGSQLLEWEFNRDIVRRTAALLQLNRVRPVILVPEDRDIPLAVRIARVNRLPGLKESLLVSIHGNAGGGTGWEIFTSPGQTRSDIAASVFFAQAKELLGNTFSLRSDTTDGDPDKEAEFGMLMHTHCPAVLTENLFMDTETDCRFMMSAVGRQLIAMIHANSILHLLNFMS